MISALAALIPIVASLYVGASFLAEFVRRNHAARVYARVRARLAPQAEELREQHEHSRIDAVTFDRLNRELNERRQLLLRLNGLDPSVGSLGHLSALGTPQSVPAVELRRQWALLVGSAAGVVLLGIDLLNGSAL